MQVDGLADELNAVAQRVLPRVFVKHGKEGPLDLPELRAVADRVFLGGWDTDGPATLEKLLRLAVSRLDGNYYGSVGRKEAAHILFNLDAPELGIDSLQLEGLSGKWYPHLLAVLKTRTNTTHTRRGLARDTSDLRLALARIMLDPQFGLNSDATAVEDAADQDLLLLSPARSIMDEEKAKQIVREVLGETDEIAIRRLALSLNFDPPLIRAACDYMKADTISVESACRILAKDAGIFLDSLARRIEQSPITRRLRQVVEMLEAEHPRSLRALDFIAFLHSEHISAEYVLAYLLECQYVDLETFEHAELIFDGAIQPLIDASLVDQDGAFLRMNPLVHSVIRELRRDKCSEINDRLASYGFTDLSTTPSAWHLMEAKWSPTSIAARWMQDYVLSARLVDQLQNHGRLARAGKLAGADWMLIVEALRVRCAEKAALSWFLFEVDRHFETNMPLLLDGSLAAWRDAKFERQKFYDRIEWLEIGPTIERVSNKLEEIIKGLPARREGTDMADLVAPYFKKQFGEFYAEVDTAFRLDEVATPVGTLRFSDYFAAWEGSQTLAIEGADNPPALERP